MTDHSAMRLGKLGPRHDPRTLQLADYIDSTILPPAPPTRNWTKALHPDLGMMMNDTTGDCTCAAAGHLIQEWTANASGTEVTVSDPDILAAYVAVSGYDPATHKNDNGAAETDVLNYWRRTGVGSHTIDAYVALEPGNHEHVRDSINLFGGCYIGLALPISAQSQLTWAVPPGGARNTGAPGSWGGHAVALVGYNPRRVTCITWGQLKQMTWGFLTAYCDEAYAVLSADFMAANQAAGGFNLQQLQEDLAALADLPVPVGVSA